MRRAIVWAAVAGVAVFALAVASRPSPPLAPDRQATAIAVGLRCPVCQGLSVADSDSQTARDLRADIGRRVDAGQTSADIRQAYVDRYGEWILLRPRNDGFGRLVWLAPPIAAAFGAGLIGEALWRWSRRRTARPTDADRQVVDAALHERVRGP
jgi:cytochrome c-type biogenesis protein CcmH